MNPTLDAIVGSPPAHPAAPVMTMPVDAPLAIAELAARVQHSITASGRSQKDIATAIGLDATKLSKCLNLKRRFKADEVTRLAEFLGLDAEWLRSGEQPPSAPGSRAPHDALVTNPKVNAAGDGQSAAAHFAAAQRQTTHGENPTPHAANGAHTAFGPDRASGMQGAARRTAILEAAGRLIARKGYHHVRMQDVARECGVSTAAVHYHFASRDLLLVSAMEHVIGQDFRRNSDALATVSTSLDKLILFVDLLLPTHQLMLDDWSLWLQFWTERITNASLRRLHNEFHQEWLTGVERLVRRGQQRGEFVALDAARFASAFTALADGLALRVLSQDPKVTPQVMREQLVSLIRENLLPTAEEATHASS